MESDACFEERLFIQLGFNAREIPKKQLTMNNPPTIILSRRVMLAGVDKERIEAVKSKTAPTRDRIRYNNKEVLLLK
jgi:hypothetical protein